MIIKKRAPKRERDGKKCTGSNIAISILPRLILATPQLNTCLINCFKEALLRWYTKAFLINRILPPDMRIRWLNSISCPCLRLPNPPSVSYIFRFIPILCVRG